MLAEIYIITRVLVQNGCDGNLYIFWNIQRKLSPFRVAAFNPERKPSPKGAAALAGPAGPDPVGEPRGRGQLPALGQERLRGPPAPVERDPARGVSVLRRPTAARAEKNRDTIFAMVFPELFSNKKGKD